MEFGTKCGISFADLEDLLTTEFNKVSEKEYLTKEEDDKRIIKLALPGIKKSNLDISVNDYKLIVKTKEAVEDEFVFINDVDKEFKIPNDVDLKNIESELKLGVLTITLHKREDLITKVEVK